MKATQTAQAVTSCRRKKCGNLAPSFQLPGQHCCHAYPVCTTNFTYEKYGSAVNIQVAMVHTQISLTNEMRQSHQSPIYDLRHRTIRHLAIPLLTPFPLRPLSFDGRMNRYGGRRQIWTFRTDGRKGEFRSTKCTKIARTYAHLIGALRFRCSKYFFQTARE